MNFKQRNKHKKQKKSMNTAIFKNITNSNSSLNKANFLKKK